MSFRWSHHFALFACLIPLTLGHATGCGGGKADASSEDEPNDGEDGAEMPKPPGGGGSEQPGPSAEDPPPTPGFEPAPRSPEEQEQEKMDERERFDEQAKPLPGTSLPVPETLPPLPVEDAKPVKPGCDVGAAAFDTRAGNRRPALAGLPDWSQAGYRSGAAFPVGASEIKAESHGVVPNDEGDDSAALQAAIDAAAARARGYGKEVVVSLPAGKIVLSREIKVHSSHLIIRGQGADAHGATSTQVVVRPGPDMAYDRLSEDGGEPLFQDVTVGSGNGGWLWPGRGAFRVQTKQVHEDYASDYAEAPARWRDVFEGTVNAHWKAGLEVDQSAAIAGARGGNTVVLDRAEAKVAAGQLAPGTFVWVAAANSLKMYASQGVTNSAYFDNNYMRVQVFTVKAYDSATRTLTLDKPLEFDVPANSTSDGSKTIEGKARPSKVLPLQMVENVGFENFFLAYDLNGLPKLKGGTYDLHPADAHLNYGNVAPEYALHGIVFKWAAHSWVRGVRMYMIGSHPVVTEVARNIQLERNAFEGSWNKGKGGNGYLRGSRVWDSLYVNNVSRGLRHFTFQWSASGNVVIGNTFDSDINFHGGWERHNLVEANLVRVPYGHASGNCRTNCDLSDVMGDMGAGTWWPLWWGAGAKAGKWSGATGPQNVLFNNRLEKQVKPDGAYVPYEPYHRTDGSTCARIIQLGWDRQTEQGSEWAPLAKAGTVIADWLGHEQVDFSSGKNTGVNAQRSETGASLFLVK